jgi:hypothetical protein
MASLEEHDSLEIRCVHLGGQVTFNYCRRVNRGLPCKLIIACWVSRVDVVGFLCRNFSADGLRRALEPEPGSRIEDLLNRLEQAQAERHPPQADR